MNYCANDIVPDQFYPASNIEPQSPVPWLFRFISFLAVIGFVLCFIQPWIGPVKEEGYNLAVRWLGFMFCTILLLGVVALCPTQRGTFQSRLYLLMIFFIAIMMFLTEFFIGFQRVNEVLGAFVFVFGIYMFVFLWPRVATTSGEAILTCTLVMCALAEFVRMKGDVANSNSVSAFCGAAGAALTLISFRRNVRMTKRIFAVGGLLVMVIFLVLARGRASMLGLGAASLICLWFGSGKGRRGFVIILLILFAFVLTGTIVGGKLMDLLATKGRDTGVFAESSLMRFSGRMVIWEGLFSSSGGFLWLGKGRIWTAWITEGHGTHSVYLDMYFNNGFFAAVTWFLSNTLLFFVAMRVINLYKAVETYPVAPVVVLFFLIFGLLENWLSNLLGARGLLFFCSVGLCFYELSKARYHMVDGDSLEFTGQDWQETEQNNHSRSFY